MKNDFKKQLIKAYNKDAKRRDSAEGKRGQWKLDIRQQFIDLLKKENKRTILELGSGAGLDAKFFQDNGFDVLATDLSPEMVKACRKRKLNAKIVDLYNLSKLRKTFDAIYSMNVLLHIPRKDLDDILENVYQILNAGGVFFYGVYGGRDKETIITDKTRMGLPRFFSFLSDASLLNVVKDKFTVINFQTIDIKSKKPDFYFQSLFLRKR